MRYDAAMMDDTPHILIVDDDTRLRSLLRKFLSEQGFRVTTAADGAEARERLRGLSFDILILDIMMPGESGLELASDLRRQNDVPILLLTARDDVADRIEGLEAGADDYLSKPFEPRELVLRLKAILRRRPQEIEVEDEVCFGEFTFDLNRGELRRGDAFVHLTSSEAQLLRALARRPGQVVSREVLGEDTAAGSGARTVDVQITRLRRKIEDDPRFPRHLQTSRGIGYVLMVDRV
jgi:two-component system phosphate regulon response regulator OmpR